MSQNEYKSARYLRYLQKTTLNDSNDQLTENIYVILFVPFNIALPLP